MAMPRQSELQERERNVYVFGLTSFMNDTASEMAYWILPAFLVSIGAGPATLGIIEGISESVVSFAKLCSGYLVDRIERRKPIVVAGYVVANAVKPLLAVAQAWWQVLGIRFADRLAKGLRGTPRDIMLAESVDKSHLGSAYGLQQAMDSAGAIAGPLAAWLLIRHVGLRGVFWAAAIPGVLSILAVTFWARETGVGRAPGAALEAGPPLRPRFSGQFYYLLAAVGIFSLGNSSDMFLVLRAQDVGISATHAPLLGLVFNITYTAFAWPAGKLSDRLPRRLLLAGGYLVFAIVYCIFGSAPGKAAIWAAMAFYGLYYAMTTPVLKALVVQAAPNNSRGRALGMFYFVSSVTALLASIATGELWKHFGARIPFYLSAGLAALAAVLLTSDAMMRKDPQFGRT
jgi:MFS family permease